MYEELYWNKEKGLVPNNQDNLNLQVCMSATDVLVGQKIQDITYTVDKEWDEDKEEWVYLPEIIIDLSNGKQIEIYQHIDGSVFIETD